MVGTSRIYVAGAGTAIGGALLQALGRGGYREILGAPPREPDLLDAAAVDAFFCEARPEFVFLAGGPSGGIRANQKYPADLMRANLLAECHVIHAAHAHGAQKLLYLASSCCYPRLCPQPMRVEMLMTGPLEPTNAAYGTAKLAGIEMCRAYRRQHGANFVAAIPANSFGPGESLDPEDSHVVAALMTRLHEARVRGARDVEVWGTGAARREFIFLDDLADACVFLMEQYDGAEPINVGLGSDLSIRELAQTIAEVVGYSGELRFDTSQPDGMPLKRLDSSRLHAMGFRPAADLRSALDRTYRWFLEAAP